MTHTLITTTKIQGPLQRLYGIKLFGSDVFNYISWRRRCGHNYRLDIRGSGGFIYAVETYEFDSMAEAWANPEATKMFKYTLEQGHDVILYTTLYNWNKSDVDTVVHETDPSKNYGRPWADTMSAIGEGKIQGVLDLTGDCYCPGQPPVRLFDLATFTG